MIEKYKDAIILILGFSALWICFLDLYGGAGKIRKLFNYLRRKPMK